MSRGPYVVGFSVDGIATWRVFEHAAALVSFARAPNPHPDHGALHVVEDRRSGPVEPLGPGVHTDLEAVLAWDGGPPLPEKRRTALSDAERRVGRRAGFLLTLQALLREATDEGLIGADWAADLATAALLAAHLVDSGRR